MASLVITTFHDSLGANLSRDSSELLRNPVGSGSDVREVHRALMLADRALREWIAAAVAQLQHGVPNRFEQLPQLGKPEGGYEAAEPVALAERDAVLAGSAHAELAARAVDLARATPEIDTESSLTQNREALETTARAAALCLLEAGNQLGGEDFVLAQANQTMKDLIALDGWTNQLGPRFEF